MFRLISASFVAFIAIFNALHHLAPYPLIDEIFHVPAAERYCNGNYAYWDPKITTPPGLYIYSNLIHRLVNVFVAVECDTLFLRFTNVLLLPIFAVTITSLNTFLYGSAPTTRSLFMLSYPMLLFFSCFYYTDTISLLLVLCYLLLQIREAQLVSTSLGLMALCCRQTNIVWLFFAASVAILYQDTPLGRAIRTLDKQLGECTLFPRCRYQLDQLSSLGVFATYGILGDLTKLKDIIISLSSAIFNAIVFVIFIYANDGQIVLGDQSAHQPMVHLLQIAYFGLFNLFFAAPILMSHASLFIAFIWRQKMAFFGLCLALCYLQLDPPVHPYLLADNRHYTFYLFKLLIKLKWLMVPVYAIGILFLVFQLPQSTLIQLAYFASVSATIVPQRLLEFRYFMVPFAILQLFSIRKPGRMAVVYNILVNAFTLYVFKTKEIRWKDIDEVQRMFW